MIELLKTKNAVVVWTSGKANNMEVSPKMLEAAMKKAVETGLLPKNADMDTYNKHWAGMKQCIQAALDVAPVKS